MNPLLQRAFSDKQRAKLADSGAALPDGSYPIKTVADLKNAIQSYGRAKNKAAVKRHIIKRAKALGATDQLPADWQKSMKQSNPGHFARKCPTCGRQLRRSVADRIQTVVTMKQDAFDASYGGVSVLPVGVGVKAPSGRIVRMQYAQNTILSKAVTKKKKLSMMKQDAMIIQADSYRRVVTAVVQQPDTPHAVFVRDAKHPDGGELIEITYPREVLTQACEEFMEKGRHQAVGLEHDECVDTDIVAPNGEHAVVVQNWISPVDFTVRDHEGLERTVKAGSWLQSYHFTSDEAWQGVLEGRLRAPSLASNEFELEDAA